MSAIQTRVKTNFAVVVYRCVVMMILLDEMGPRDTDRDIIVPADFTLTHTHRSRNEVASSGGAK